MQSVTSNGVANAIAERTYIYPLLTTHSVSSDGTSWHQILWLGNYFYEKFASYPNISGKQKKVRLLMTIFTYGNNGITVGIKKQNDTSLTILINNAVIWGGVEVGTFARFASVTIDPEFLRAYSAIQIKSSDSQKVAVGFIFAEVYYE